jgi:hypothetical protein
MSRKRQGFLGPFIYQVQVPTVRYVTDRKWNIGIRLSGLLIENTQRVYECGKKIRRT